MKILDNTGLKHLWDKITAKLSSLNADLKDSLQSATTFKPVDTLSPGTTNTYCFLAERNVIGNGTLSIYVTLPKNIDKVNSIETSVNGGASFGFIDRNGYHTISSYNTHETIILSKPLRQIRISYLLNNTDTSSWERIGIVRLNGLNIWFQ